MRSPEEINERLDDLSAVLFYDALKPENEKHFKTGERILINQERGSLYDQINFLNGDLPPKNVREFNVTKELEDKIQFVLKKINNEH